MRAAGAMVLMALAVVSVPGAAAAQTPGEVFRKVTPSVVVIRAKGSELTARGLVRFTETGSGVLISSDGKVMTAAHVVHSMNDISVEFLGGETVSAKVIESEPAADLSLLQLERVPPGARVAQMANSDTVRVGDPVYIVGAPYGLHWGNAFPIGNPSFNSDSFTYLDTRIGFFTFAYSTSPGMAVNMENVGAKYLATRMDADGDFLDGSRNYKLHVPKDIPVAIFWSATVYDPMTGSGLDNGQPFPSLNTMDKPVQNPDGTTDIYFGPKTPGADKNWLATIPGKGWFTIFRLYGPKKAFFDQTWKLNDIEKVK